jgi:hypothetical protein
MSCEHVEDYNCPISGELMFEPVVDRDGHVYDKEHILQWLKSHNTSPITRKEMRVSDLAPARFMRKCIEEYCMANKIGRLIHIDPTIEGVIRSSCCDKVIYRGEMRGGVRNGRGEEYACVGNLLYRGLWKDNAKHGRGKLYHASGKLRYVGEWVTDKWHGRGKSYTSDGYLDYVGGWKSGLMCGTGKSYDIDGTVIYSGQLEGSKASGYGTSYINRKKRYKGQFKDNHAHGRGTLYLDGEVYYEGQFDSVNVVELRCKEDYENKISCVMRMK